MKPNYWDNSERWRVDGTERTCSECGEPHMVTREEAGMVDVFHSWCLDRILERNRMRRQQMSGDAA
jgi:hypothetical protein